ncbi:MAG TPA: 3-oxoacid CoA-transferase subunit A [Acetobacteraceae bacterium]|nr:3-oxoacid CoA-transferase subunit A [Acetobacteraceae bacterium]
MIDKFVPSAAAALEGVRDGATVLIAGFGEVGVASLLLEALIAHGARDLTLVCNSGGRDGTPLVRLMELGRVRKLICSFVRPASVAGRLQKEGKLETEIVPQGTLAERVRAGGAGIEGFYTPTGADTVVAEGRERRQIGGKMCLLELPIRGDLALVDAWEGDRWGNLTFRGAQRNFNPLMAMAADLAVAQCVHRRELGEIAPEHVHLPGMFVDRVVHLPEAERRA